MHFGDEDAAADLLYPYRMPPRQVVRMPQLLLLRTVTQADLEALKPAHRRCLSQPEPTERGEGEPPYDLLRSVS